MFNTATEAIISEKKLKGWIREKKIKLIETKNPEWEDLSNGILRSAQDDNNGGQGTKKLAR